MTFSVLSTKVSQQQLNMVDSYKFSFNIERLMNDGKSYQEAIAETLENEGWVLQDSPLTFYNTKTKQYANVTPYCDMFVPTTNDPYIVNAFRVVYDNLYYSVEPNEWTSVYDSRKGRKFLKNAAYREMRVHKRNRRKHSLNYNPQYS